MADVDVAPAAQLLSACNHDNCQRLAEHLRGRRDRSSLSYEDIFHPLRCHRADGLELCVGTGRYGGGSDQLIGPARIQAEAVQELLDNGPQSYEELKENLGYEKPTMQKIMRHIVHYNGLVGKETQPDGSIRYTANVNERIAPYIAGSDQGGQP